jgi:hypothetical protein
MQPLRPVRLRARVLERQSGLCEGCAPDLDEEIASAQAQAAKAHGAEFCPVVRQALRRVMRSTYGLKT